MIAFHFTKGTTLWDLLSEALLVKERKRKKKKKTFTHDPSITHEGCSILLCATSSNQHQAINRIGLSLNLFFSFFSFHDRVKNWCWYPDLSSKLFEIQVFIGKPVVSMLQSYSFYRFSHSIIIATKIRAWVKNLNCFVIIFQLLKAELNNLVCKCLLGRTSVWKNIVT